MRYIYRVSAKHVSPDYACKAQPVLVRQDSDGTFSATASRYGCGKDAPTAEAAIRSLLADNACTDIVITGPHKSGPYLALSDA